MRHPVRIDPATRMPVYFHQGRSLNLDHYGGDAERQIRAIWEYLSLGPDMPSPLEVPSRRRSAGSSLSGDPSRHS